MWKIKIKIIILLLIYLYMEYLEDSDYIFKILIVGNTCVGKSSLLLKYTDNIFMDSFLPTIGIDFKIKTL